MLGERFERALLFAARTHAGQRRKGGSVPYLAHLMGTCSLVLEAGGDEDAAIAALLHDTAEDHGAALLQTIEEQFGAAVATIVRGCTDSLSEPRPPWRARKERYLAHLASASAQVRLVATADKLHNARALLSDYLRRGEPLWDLFSGGRSGVLWYYSRLRDVLDGPEAPWIAGELRRTVDALLEAAARTVTDGHPAGAGRER